MAKVFISYATADSQFVQNELIHALKNNSIETWYSGNDIHAADQWEREIREGLVGSEWFLVVLSKNSVNSKWVRREVLWAMEHRPDHFVPVLLEDCDPTDLHFALDQIQYVDYRGDQAAARAELLKTCRGIVSHVPVIALMGAKGGVGKTTITFCIAQMIAEMKHEVAIIDFDLLDEGATNEAKRSFPAHHFAVKTLYDHLADHSSYRPIYPSSTDQRLCDITPPHLHERGLGSIWLLPARDKHKNKNPFQMLMGMPEPYTETFRALTHEIIRRVRAERPAARIILIDCGAGRNTLFSAAFAEADLGYIITLPNKAYYGNIAEHLTELATLYPRANLYNIFTVINRVTSSLDILSCDALSPRPIAFIPFDPTVEKDKYQLGVVEYGLGYNEFFAAVRDCLYRSLPKGDHHLLPDEFETRHKPWLRTLVEDHLAKRTLESRDFRLRTVGSWFATIVTILMAVYLGFLHYRTPLLLSPEPRSSQYFFLMLIAAVLFVIAAYWLIFFQEPRRNLLKQIAQLPTQLGKEHQELLKKLLREPKDSTNWLVNIGTSINRSRLRWANKLVEEKLEKEKERRYSVLQE